MLQCRPAVNPQSPRPHVTRSHLLPFPGSRGQSGLMRARSASTLRCPNELVQAITNRIVCTKYQENRQKIATATAQIHNMYKYIKLKKRFKTCSGDQDRCLCHGPVSGSYHGSHLNNSLTYIVVRTRMIRVFREHFTSAHLFWL